MITFFVIIFSTKVHSIYVQYIFLTETLLVSRARVARLSAPSALISSSLAVSSWSGESVLAMEGCRGINVNFSESKYRSIEKLSNVGIGLRFVQIFM